MIVYFDAKSHSILNSKKTEKVLEQTGGGTELHIAVRAVVVVGEARGRYTAVLHPRVGASAYFAVGGSANGPAVCNG